MSIKNALRRPAAIFAAAALTLALGSINQISTTAKESDDIKAEIDDLGNDLKASEEEAERLTDEIQAAEAEADRLQEETEEQEKIVEEQKDDMSLRIKYFYEAGDESFFESLLSADSFSDLLNKILYEQKVYDYDSDKLQEYVDAEQELSDKRDEYVAAGKELSGLLKEQEDLQTSLSEEISQKQDEYEKAKQKEAEEAARAAAESRLAGTDAVGEFEGYEMSDSELSGFTALCEREQGTTAEGVAAEASLIANRYEKHGGGYSSIYSYVANCGWWGKSAGSYMSSHSARNSSNIEVVRDVVCSGNRTLPLDVDEHDYIGDITSVSNNGESFSVSDRSKYISGTTKIHNRYGATYTFYCFSHEGGDPFGSTSK